MRKMKDMRESHVSAIQTAILKTFGLQLASNKYKNLKDILEWKKSREVKDCYNKIFTESTTIENITSSTFPSLNNASDEKYSDMYAYTASVCDILLNLDYFTLEVSKKPLELRLRRFKVFIEFICYLKINFVNQSQN